MSPASKAGLVAKRGATNKKLLMVLGVVVVLAVVFKGLPALVGGGGGAVAPPRPVTALHLHKTQVGSTASGGSAVAAPATGRDPFGPGPGTVSGR